MFQHATATDYVPGLGHGVVEIPLLWWQSAWNLLVILFLIVAAVVVFRIIAWSIIRKCEQRAQRESEARLHAMREEQRELSQRVERESEARLQLMREEQRGINGSKQRGLASDRKPTQ
jgi:flagellar biosynthesis/type III secretory pathway M-ring protein FliF/YscJ